MSSITTRRAARVLAAVAVATAAIGLSACANGGSASPGASGSPGTAALSMPYLTNQFMVSLNGKTTGALKDAGWTVLSTTDAGSQPDKQVQDVKNLIAAGAKALAIDPFDSGAIVAALDAAKAAGVPVVLVDVGASGGESYMTVRADNVGAAASVCEQMGKLLTDRYGTAKGTVLELQGELSSIAGQDRTSGFEDCMKQKYPDVKIVAQPTNWDGTKAANAAQTVVASQDIDGIYVQSDCGMLAPVQAVLKQAGKSTSVDDPDHIILGGIDGCPTTLDQIRSGQVDFTVEQPLTAYGQRVAFFLDAALKGKTFSEGSDGFDGTIRKTETGSLEDLLPATLVTKDNVETPTLWGNGD